MSHRFMRFSSFMREGSISFNRFFSCVVDSVLIFFFFFGLNKVIFYFEKKLMLYKMYIFINVLTKFYYFSFTFKKKKKREKTRTV